MQAQKATHPFVPWGRLASLVRRSLTLNGLGCRALEAEATFRANHIGRPDTP